RGSRGLGLLMGAMGTGAVIGTLALARHGRTEGLARRVGFSGTGMGLGFLLFAVSPSFGLAVAAMPLIGFAMMQQLASANTCVQTSIPDDYRGRVMALYSMTVIGFAPFAGLGAGALAEQTGARATMALGGVLALVACAVFLWNSRRESIAA